VDEFGRFLQVEADFKGFSRLSGGDEFAGMLRACQNPPRRNVRAMAIASRFSSVCQRSRAIR
jgi:hypothetical protein